MTASKTDTPRPKESVWDYPRPPRLEPTSRHIRIVHAGLVIADTTGALRILETSHPPVYYLPQTDIAMHLLQRSTRRGSFCEFKGVAAYWNLHLPSPTPQTIPDVAWSYASPTHGYAALANHLAFYPGRLRECNVECSVDGEIVLAQPGDFYGGWITSDLTGPFKGAPGTLGW